MQNRASDYRRTGLGSFHHITFTSGSKSTTLFVRPTVLIGAAVLCLVLSLGYFGATAYWFVRDDMTASAEKERHEIETYYQDRIDRLKAEIQKINSRQAVDRENLELQVTDLMRRQQDLTKRHEVVTELMVRAEQNGIRIAGQNAIPPVKPDQNDNDIAAIESEDTSAMGGESQPVADPVKALGMRDSEPSSLDKASFKRSIDPGEQAALESVDHDLTRMGRQSSAVLDALAVATENQIASIVNTTRPLGVSLLKKSHRDEEAVGGPFIPVTGGSFSERVSRTEQALNTLHRVKNRARMLPLGRPLAKETVSSRFGARMDPFLNKLAMHTGIDFKALRGTKVFAAAPGTVEKAGWHGGYGKMIEIRHANGLVTRYGHLNRVLVSEGDHVATGDVIGKVGSTGRSTGPHLHFEIRRSDKAINPAPFVAAGNRLAKYLKL